MEPAGNIMTYPETVAYLMQRLPMFSRTGAAAYKKDLHNIRRLCDALGNPQHKFKSIHVGGTNGKGSVSTALAAVLQAAGYKTGLHTSPHLVDFRERIRIDGELCTESFVVDFTARIAPLIEEIEPSFFEISVAMAFEWFAQQQVDVAVIEVGLGGRLDSTNIITPLLSVITNIGLDHTDLLGTTLAEIAGEKAGIIKPGIPVVVGAKQPETESIFREKALAEKSEIFFAPDFGKVKRVGGSAAGTQYEAQVVSGETFLFTSDLQGFYQEENLATVLLAAGILEKERQFTILPAALKEGLAQVARAGLRGRYEVLQNQPLIVADVAHNADGLKSVVAQFKSESAGRNMHIVAGFVRDKDLDAALSLLPVSARYYWCNAQIPRALPAAELAALATHKGLTGEVFSSVEEAVKTARNILGTNDCLLITGSFFIVGEALPLFGGV